MAQYVVKPGGIHERFLNFRRKVQIFGGGFGNGKSACAVIKCIKLALDYPGSNGLIARETYPKLNDTIRKEFYKWIPRGMVKRWPTKDDNTMILKNGSTINFRYIAQRGKTSIDGYSTSNLLSATYDWIFVDQMEDPGITYKDFLDLMGRLRGSTTYKGNDPTMPITGPRFFMMAANPTANWFYKMLVAPHKKWEATGVVTDALLFNKKKNEPLIDLVEGSTYENAHNLDEDFIEGLETAYQGQMRDRFLLGKWAAYEGLVYPQFDTEVHMYPREVLMAYLRSFNHKLLALEGLDLGLSKPSCYLVGFRDLFGSVYVIDGFYKPTPDPSELGTMIVELQAKYEDLLIFGDEPIYADPAIFRKTPIINRPHANVDTVAKILDHDYDLNIIPGQNDINSGIMKVTKFLNVRKHGHFQDIEKPGPSIYFASELDFIEAEMTSYFWKVDSFGDRIDEPNGKDDHACDTIKYMLSKIPEPSKNLYRIPDVPPEFLKWHEMR